MEEQFVEGFLYVVENFTRNPILAEVVAPGSTFLIDIGMKYFSFAAETLRALTLPGTVP